MPITLVERLAFQIYLAEHLILRLDKRHRRLPLWHALTEDQRNHYRQVAARELDWLKANMNTSTILSVWG